MKAMVNHLILFYAQESSLIVCYTISMCNTTNIGFLVNNLLVLFLGICGGYVSLCQWWTQDQVLGWSGGLTSETGDRGSSPEDFGKSDFEDTF